VERKLKLKQLIKQDMEIEFEIFTLYDENIQTIASNNSGEYLINQTKQDETHY